MYDVLMTCLLCVSIVSVCLWGAAGVWFAALMIRLREDGRHRR